MNIETQRKVRESKTPGREEPTRVVDASESQVVEGRELAPVQAAPLAMIPDAPPEIVLIQQALQMGRSSQEMKELLELVRDMRKDRAKQAFNDAMAKFKHECPPIPRRTENPQFKVTRDGKTVVRKFASLEDIEETTRPHLGANGLSYRWGDMKIENGVLTMPCIVSHRGGHSESSQSMPMPVESKAGCSDQQKVGAAQTYAMRYSLIAALGLTSCDDDTDGEDDPTTITEEQAIKLQERVESMNHPTIKTAEARKASFLKRFGVTRFVDIPAARMGEAEALLGGSK